MHARPPPRPLWLFSARGSGSLYLPAALRLPFPVGLFRFALCPSLFFLSSYLRGSLSLCLPVQLSLGPFSVPKLGQESFKVMASSSLGWRSGSQVSDPAPQPLLELRQLEGRGNIPFLKEQGHSRGEN